MDFFSDLKNLVAGELTRRGIEFDPAAEVRELILLVCNHELKGIKPVKREVHTSTEFNAELLKLAGQQQTAAKAIQQKFIQGNDVNPHLGSQGNSSDNAGDVDQLLGEWGIYHIHISTHKKKPNDRFFARTGPVIYAHVNATDVYFIDIYPHGGWSRQKLLQIVNRTWPDLYKAARLDGASLSVVVSDEDIKKLRGPTKTSKRPGAAITTSVQIGNSVLFPPGGGLAADGTPTMNVYRTLKTIRSVKKLEKLAAEKSSEWKSVISKDTNVPVEKLDFELVPLSPPGFGIREKITGTMVYEMPEKKES